MATDSDKKLTKFTSAVTIVTADFANSFFGGLYGTAEGESLDDDDPRIRGHVHTGEHVDGHVSRVHLYDHVTDMLQNKNLGDDAVTKRNVLDSSQVSNAIPEYRVDGDNKFYYLDLRHIRADFVFQEDEDPGLNTSGEQQHKLIKQRDKVWDDSLVDGEGVPDPDYVPIENVWEADEGYDFVFGSSSLDDLDLDTDGDSRFQFDKSKSAFRAGRVTGTQWDQSNRGDNSVAFGENNTASGDNSGVSAGAGNTASGDYSGVSAGAGNTASGDYSGVSAGTSNTVAGTNSGVSAGAGNTVAGTNSGVSAGAGNTVAGNLSGVSAGAGHTVAGHNSGVSAGAGHTVGGDYSGVSAGAGHTVDGDYSGVSAGNSNTASGDYSGVSAGNSNTASGDYSGVSSGNSNTASGDYSGVSAGSNNTASGDYSTIGGGGGANLADGNTVDGNYSGVGAGKNNSASGDYAGVSAGDTNIAGGDWSHVGGGNTNDAAGVEAAIGGGNNNEANADRSYIGGGRTNVVNAELSVVSGGESNKVILGGGTASANYGTIAGGHANKITPGNDASANYATIAGGDLNQIAPVTSANYATIGGGQTNLIDDSEYGTVAGGHSNQAVNANAGTVSGGLYNELRAESGVISGGSANNLYSSAVASTISGGFDNNISSKLSVISGGGQNIIRENSDYGSITGGQSNTILGEYSTVVGGHESKILDYNDGSVHAELTGEGKEIGSNNSVIVGAGNAAADIVGHDYYACPDPINFPGPGDPQNGGPDGINDYENAGNLTIGAGYESFAHRFIGPSASNHSGIFGGNANHIAGGFPLTYDDGAGSNITAPAPKNNFIIGGSDNRLGAAGIAPGMYNISEAVTIYNSQIFGGENNEISAFAGGNTPVPNNPIPVSFQDYSALKHGLIVGGSRNAVIMGGSGLGSMNVLYSGIIGGYSNRINHIPLWNDPYDVASPPIIAPWYEVPDESNFNISNYGVQTSYVFGGIKNSITNTDSRTGANLSFSSNSLYSAILGGQNNVIASSYGASILGGGSFVDVQPFVDTNGDGQADSPTATEPPYNVRDGWYSNVIERGHHSSILNGSSNLIKEYSTGYFTIYDPENSSSPAVPGTSRSIDLNTGDPIFSISQGRESYAYLYGQNAYASGGHTFSKFNPGGLPGGPNDPTNTNYQFASNDISPFGYSAEDEFSVHMGCPKGPLTVVDVDGDPNTPGEQGVHDIKDQPGTAQASTLTFFGSWDYPRTSIASFPGDEGGVNNNVQWDPTIDSWWNDADGTASSPGVGMPNPVGDWNNNGQPYFIFNAYLDGGRDALNHGGASSANRCFIPRFPGSYSFVINGSISYTALNRTYHRNGGEHGTASFVYNGYIVWQPNGEVHYGGRLTSTSSTRPYGATVGLFGDPDVPINDIGNGMNAGTDFYIAFCPDGRTPVNAYDFGDERDRWGTLDANGSSCKFSLLVANNTGHPNHFQAGTCNGTARPDVGPLVGESLVARADVVENLLFLGLYPPMGGYSGGIP